ncbi:MAG: hypothetical protein IJD22_05900 [Clostridia bacterium]|nr:hypothetical protein [Clostridia bacterium]
MKTCTKCGKNVSDATPMCPRCNCVAFHTDKNAYEGFFSQMLMELLEKKPKLAFAIIGVIIAAFVIFLIWAFNS